MLTIKWLFLQKIQGGKMVTFVFILVLFLLTQLILVVDMILFNYSYMETVLDIYYSQDIADRRILVLSITFGLGWSIITDVRRRKKQKKSVNFSAGD